MPKETEKRAWPLCDLHICIFKAKGGRGKMWADKRIVPNIFLKLFYCWDWWRIPFFVDRSGVVGLEGCGVWIGCGGCTGPDATEGPALKKGTNC